MTPDPAPSMPPAELPPSPPRRGETALERFLGGPPLWVLFRLAMISVLVGIVLSVFGFDPGNIFWRLRLIFRAMFENFQEFLSSIMQWLILGMVIVVPLFLLKRMLSGKR